MSKLTNVPLDLDKVSIIDKAYVFNYIAEIYEKIEDRTVDTYEVLSDLASLQNYCKEGEIVK